MANLRHGLIEHQIIIGDGDLSDYDDLGRASIVLAVAAMDSYFTEAFACITGSDLEISPFELAATYRREALTAFFASTFYSASLASTSFSRLKAQP